MLNVFADAPGHILAYEFRNDCLVFVSSYFKILAKTFGIRIQKVLQNIISSDQVGYLVGRYIGQNIRLIQDVIDLCNNRQQPGVVAFLDFEKAFFYTKIS